MVTRSASLKLLLAPLASPAPNGCRNVASCAHALHLGSTSQPYINVWSNLAASAWSARFQQRDLRSTDLTVMHTAGNRNSRVRTWASFAQMQVTQMTDPFSLVKGELTNVSTRIRSGIVSEIPALQQAAGYFFQRGSEGKQLRPSICLLLSSALSPHPPSEIDMSTPDLRPVGIIPTEARRRQQRIAEIAELIHVASLLHDDVIDDADSRRGKPALNLVLGNKLAILAGDFLLARASMTLASLEDTAVVSLMSQILEDLVSGEVLQATAPKHELSTMDLYLKKTYLKTASLMANACKSSAVLSDGSTTACEAAFQYGKQLGLAFQARHPHHLVLPLLMTHHTSKGPTVDSVTSQSINSFEFSI